MCDLLNAPIQPIQEAPKQLNEELTTTTNLTMNQQMGDNLMMGNRQQQQDGQQGLLMAPKQTTTTIANLNTSLVDTKLAAQPEEEYPDELEGALKNESSASKKNRASKVKNAGRKYNTTQAARQNTAMLSTRRRLEDINDALKHAPRDEYGEIIGGPPAELSFEEKKTYTKQEKAVLDASIAEIEAMTAHELAKLEAKKKFHVDDKTRKGIMLDTDTMALQMDSLSQQKSAWEEYGRRQQLGDKEAMLVEKKVTALQKKVDSLQEKRIEILDERYRQQWVQDGNISENGMMISGRVAVLDNRRDKEEMEHKKFKNKSLLKKTAPATMSITTQVTLFTGKYKDVIGADDESIDERQQSHADANLEAIEMYVETALAGVYSPPGDKNLLYSDLSKKATETEWIKEKHEARENPQLYPRYSKTDWIQQPSIGTLEDEQASYEKFYEQEKEVFLLRYFALDVSITAQNVLLKDKRNARSPSIKHKEDVENYDAEAWALQKEEWHNNMANGADFCEDYFTDIKEGSVVPYTAVEMEERKKIYTEVIAGRGDTDSMELAQERTELMNTQGYVPPEKRYANEDEDDDISLYEEDEERLERNELEAKENGAKQIAELKELREAEKNPQQSNPNKFVYKPPEYGLEQKPDEDQDSYTARNKGFLKLHPKMEYVQWQINALTVRLLPLRHAVLVTAAMTKAEKKEHASLEKKLLSLRQKSAELHEQYDLLLLVEDKFNDDRKGVREENIHGDMLEQKMYALKTYAAQTTPHTKEYRSAMKQVEAYMQKMEDWKNTCKQREVAWQKREDELNEAYQWKQGAPAREAAAAKKAEEERKRAEEERIADEKAALEAAESLADSKEEAADEMAEANADLKELEKQEQEQAKAAH